MRRRKTCSLFLKSIQSFIEEYIQESKSFHTAELRLGNLLKTIHKFEETQNDIEALNDDDDEMNEHLNFMEESSVIRVDLTGIIMEYN